VDARKSSQGLVSETYCRYSELSNVSVTRPRRPKKVDAWSIQSCTKVELANNECLRMLAADLTRYMAIEFYKLQSATSPNKRQGESLTNDNAVCKFILWRKLTPLDSEKYHTIDSTVQTSNRSKYRTKSPFWCYTIPYRNSLQYHTLLTIPKPSNQIISLWSCLADHEVISFWP